MNRNDYIHIIEEIFELDEGDLSEQTVLEECEEWDSLSKLSLIATVKKQFQTRLTVEEIKEFVTVKDICDYMEKQDGR